MSRCGNSAIGDCSKICGSIIEIRAGTFFSFSSERDAVTTKVSKAVFTVGSEVCCAEAAVEKPIAIAIAPTSAVG
ncbi:hypothetical protein D3C80_1116800 [compost metagenome]